MQHFDEKKNIKLKTWYTPEIKPDREVCVWNSTLLLLSQKGSHPPRKKSILKVSTSTSTEISKTADRSETVVQLKPFVHHLLSSDSGQCSDGGLDEPKQKQPPPQNKHQHFHQHLTASEIASDFDTPNNFRVCVWILKKLRKNAS